MGDYGICQEIAPAYAYLLLQVGVDAGICGSLSKDGDSAHAWTMVKLNDTWYHADVTWQLSDPYGLRYCCKRVRPHKAADDQTVNRVIKLLDTRNQKRPQWSDP